MTDNIHEKIVDELKSALTSDSTKLQNVITWFDNIIIVGETVRICRKHLKKLFSKKEDNE